MGLFPAQDLRSPFCKQTTALSPPWAAVRGQGNGRGTFGWKPWRHAEGLAPVLGTARDARQGRLEAVGWMATTAFLPPSRHPRPVESGLSVTLSAAAGCASSSIFHQLEREERGREGGVDGAKGACPLAEAAPSHPPVPRHKLNQQALDTGQEPLLRALWCGLGR